MAFAVNNTLWNWNEPMFTNLEIRKSYPQEISQGSYQLGRQKQKQFHLQQQVISMGIPAQNAEPAYRQQTLYGQPVFETEMNEEIINKSIFNTPDPRQNKTGEHISYDNRVANMDIQAPVPNNTGMLVLIGLFGAAAFFMARG